VSHVGSHPTLEDQMGEFTSNFDRDAMGYSPDRVDALVWGITHLMLSAATDGTNVMDHYRREHADVVKRAQAQRTGGVSTSGWTKLVPPDGVSTATGMAGDEYRLTAEGYMEVKPDDAAPLLGAGFRRYEVVA
jgi:hypothetical protein